MIGTIAAEFNALGVTQSSYKFTDTLLLENTYSYDIVGLMENGIKEILDHHTVTFYKSNEIFNQTLDLSLNLKEGLEVTMLLIDKRKDKALRHSSFEFQKAQDQRQRIYVGDYIKMGVRNFIVRVVSGKTYNVTYYEFVVMEDGSITKL